MERGGETHTPLLLKSLSRDSQSIGKQETLIVVINKEMYPQTYINRIPLVLKTDAGRTYFQFHINGKIASLEYTLKGGQQLNLIGMDISDHLDLVEVGNALIERVMEYAQKGEFKVVATSAEVLTLIQKRPEYLKLTNMDTSTGKLNE
ncbi:hypothetical protein [Allomuricauda sp. NBRC 101325]|uniref:hypothetical protein n=1 Tax=Allomuricauda sp. NBRC 101325 TaxID=1113758 RepID=UPI0024A23E2A|nr:hypothetical protein [Muricauda sp. NBRC 101325]GLU45356.1 hypothetical protein Musp01_29800 [Muricauda sp. NBRC 101325]